MLTRLDYVHFWQNHGQAEYLPLKDLDFNPNNIHSILTHLKEKDVIRTFEKYEEDAMANKQFNEDMKGYISEEFSCLQEHSFPLICTLQFMKKFGTNAIETITDLINLSSIDSVCSSCVKESVNLCDVKKYVALYNSQSLQRNNVGGIDKTKINSCTNSNKQSADTFDEPLCNPFLSQLDDSDVFDFGSSADQLKLNIVNPFLEASGNLREECDIASVNTFLEASDIPKEEDDKARFSPQANSTELSVIEHHPVKTPSKQCEYCRKSFTNSNNLKIHLIRFIMNIHHRSLHSEKFMGLHIFCVN